MRYRLASPQAIGSEEVRLQSCKYLGRQQRHCLSSSKLTVTEVLQGSFSSSFQVLVYRWSVDTNGHSLSLTFVSLNLTG